MRRAGVAGDDDAELLANLATIAREDSDPGVRSAALKRLADPALAQRLAQEDADAGVRADARRLWSDLLAATHPQSPSPAECARLLRAQDDAALIEHVARTAQDTELRAAALARATRAAFLAERAVEDASPELRLAAIERIADAALLDRLAERTRKTDKRVSRRARERADALRIAAGDSNVAEARARTLCERLEHLVRNPQDAVAEADIEAQWSALETQVSEALRSRYRAARQLLAAAREAAQVSPPAPVAADVHHDDEINDETAGQPASTDATPPTGRDAPAATAAPDDEDAKVTAQDVIAAAAQARFSASLNAASAIKRQEEDQRETRIESAIAVFESAVEDGVVARAHAAHAELVELRNAPMPRALSRRLAEAERRYAELSRWQHWSDNQRRRQLCEAIEELSGSGLHPDAIATRVREAQTEWSRLDAAEGHSSGNAAHGWARRFHAACRHALEPAKSYFRKRQELRKTHAQAVANLLEQVRAIPEDSTDWPLLARTRHAIVDALRTLDRIDPHERKAAAKNLKSALASMDARLAVRHGEVERAKAELIAEAEALAASEPPRGAAAAARALQQRWREIGNGRRDRDQAQWKAFRSALDAVFVKLDADRSQRIARDAEARTRAAELCAELEQYATNDEPPPRATLAKLESEWESLRLRDDALQRRFRAAQATLRDAGTRRDRAARSGQYEAWLARYTLCRAAETRGDTTADELRAAWDGAPAGEIAASALAARFEAAIERRGFAQTDTGASDETELRDMLIRIEIFAGVESPREDHERRRELQIERLSARLRGGPAATPHQELADWLTRWTELPPASAELDERLRRDLAAAIETLP